MERKGESQISEQEEMNGGCTAYKEKKGKEDRRKKGVRRRGSVLISWDRVEKCDLVPRPGDISSTQLIDF